MEQYDVYLKKIQEYLYKPDVVDSDDVISAHSLIEIIENYMGELKKVINSPLIDEINNNRALVKKIMKKFNHNIFISDHKCVQVKVGNDGVKSIISIVFDNHTYQGLQRLNLFKENDKPEIYFNCGVFNRKNNSDAMGIINTHYAILSRTFDVLEKFNTLFDGSMLVGTLSKIQNCFHDENFDFTFTFNGCGEVFYGLDIRDNDNQQIKSLIEKFGKQILAKIPIEISELDSVSKKIVVESTIKKSKQLTKKKNC